MTAYLYRCLEPASPEHPADAEQFIDAQELSSQPFLTRPEARRLNAVFKRGDRVTLALEEVCESMEGLMVLGGWDGRGVEVFILRPEPGCETFKDVVGKVQAIHEGLEKSFAKEDAAYKAMCN